MRAWRVTGTGDPDAVMRLEQTALEPLGPGELRVRVKASALGFPDVLMCRGTYPLTPALPFTPGQEFAGTVAEAGPGAATPAGTKVMGVAAFMLGRGAFAEECKTFDTMVFPVDDGMDDAEAAGFTIGFHTAYIALARRAALKPGEVLLVHGGAGGTGAAAIQLGKALGARVIATAGGAEKAALCRTLGAEAAIDTTAEDFVSAVNAATHGRGADIIYDPVGGEMYEKSLGCIAQEGRLLPIGFASGRWGQIPLEAIVLKQISVIGALGGGYERDAMLAMHKALLALHRAGKIRTVVDRRIGFDDIRDGVQALSDRKVKGRMVAVY